MKDFSDEVVGYLGNRRIGQVLEKAIAAASGNARLDETAMHLWRALHAADVIPPQELPVIEAWMAQLATITSRS